MFRVLAQTVVSVDNNALSLAMARTLLLCRFGLIEGCESSNNSSNNSHNDTNP